jgi:hypothetical protein
VARESANARDSPGWDSPGRGSPGRGSQAKALENWLEHTGTELQRRATPKARGVAEREAALEALVAEQVLVPPPPPTAATHTINVRARTNFQ